MITWMLALLMTTAFAGSNAFYLEGPMVDSRRDATEMSRKADALDLNARVVRRFAQGSGWRFVLVVEGFEAESSANDAAVKLSGSVGQPITLFQQSDGTATRLQTIEPALILEGPSDATDTFEHDMQAVLTRAVAAHGGEVHPVTAAPLMLFRFRRTLPGGLTALHTVVRRGADLYVQVDVESGEGVSSRAWVQGDAAWLSVNSGAAEAKDAVWSREQLEQFLPERVLALPLGFGHAVTQRREFQQLYADGQARSGDTRCLVLKYDGDQVSAPLALYLEEDSFRTRRVVSGADARDYSDYREVSPGAVAPFRLTVTREGQTVDTVEVLDLELSPRLDEAWFAQPE